MKFPGPFEEIRLQAKKSYLLLEIRSVYNKTQSTLHNTHESQT